MSISFNFELNNKPTRKNTYKILLRITQDRKHKRINTLIEVDSPRDFNPKAKQGNWVRASEPMHKVWNDTLSDEIEKAKKTYKELKKKGIATNELITNTIKESDHSTSFLEYAKNRSWEILKEGGHRNYKKYNGFCNKLEGFLKSIRRTDIQFIELNATFISKFEAYLHSLRNERNSEATLHPNTIAINLNIFKTILNRSIEIDKIITPEQNPFLGYKYSREIATTKDKLNQDEIEKIENLELPANSVIWNARNCFLFSFYLAGIRVGDLIQLRWCNITADERIEYRMAKTKKERSIYLHDKAKSILKKYYNDECNSTDYIFPFLDSKAPYAMAVTPEQKATLPPDLIIKLNNAIGSKNALLNKYLNKIIKLTQIDKHVSMHVARHSFAKIAKDNKVDNNHLKNLLGHSNIKITETYMGSFETEETDKVMASIFNKKDEPKTQIISLLDEMDAEQIQKLLKKLKK